MVNSVGHIEQCDSAATAGALLDDDVHVWLIDLAMPEVNWSLLLRSLDENEQNRSACFRFEEDRLRYVISHAALRDVLSGYLSIEPVRIRFQKAAAGKPGILQSCNNEPMIHFSLSHSHALAAVAISRTVELGIDVEWQRELPDIEAIARHHCTAAELDVLQMSAEPLRTFYRCWTAKEAVAKCVGSGLGMALDAFPVLRHDQQLVTSVVLPTVADNAESRLWLQGLSVLPQGYAGAVAARLHDQSVHQVDRQLSSLRIVNKVWHPAL